MPSDPVTKSPNGHADPMEDLFAAHLERHSTVLEALPEKITELQSSVSSEVHHLAGEIRKGIEDAGKEQREGMEAMAAAMVKSAFRFAVGMFATITVLVFAVVALSGGTLYLKYRDAEIHTGTSAAEQAP